MCSSVPAETEDSLTFPSLGRVDGFHQYHSAGKTDEGCVAGAGFVAAHGDAFEALELADGLFDAGPQTVEALWEEPASLPGIFATWDDRRDAAVTGGLAIGGTVVALVGHGDAGADIGSDVERGFELGAVAGLAAGQMEVERPAVEIGFEVDFGREAAARAAERLMLLPPFAPAAETWARAVALSKNCTKCAVWLCSASS